MTNIHDAIATGIAKELGLNIEILAPISKPNTSNFYYIKLKWYHHPKWANLRQWNWSTKELIEIHDGKLLLGGMYHNTRIKEFNLNDPNLIQHIKTKLICDYS